MSRRGVIETLVLCALAAAAGWGGHRVYSRLRQVASTRAAARRWPAAPVVRDLQRTFAFVPSAEPAGGGFWMGRCEVTCGEFAAFLNDTRREDFTSPQYVREDGAWQAVRPADPVHRVSLADARGFAQWYAVRHACRARLPDQAEWERAARGGIPAAPYAWGWGEPSNRAVFARSGPQRTGSYPANGFGLYDCSGNVAEWCEPGPEDPPGTGVVRGGSWADRDPAQLDPGRAHRLPATYRDADVGFRLLLEPAPQPSSASSSGG